jgi:hypothetical protein
MPRLVLIGFPALWDSTEVKERFVQIEIEFCAVNPHPRFFQGEISLMNIIEPN